MYRRFAACAWCGSSSGACERFGIGSDSDSFTIRSKETTPICWSRPGVPPISDGGGRRSRRGWLVQPIASSAARDPSSLTVATCVCFGRRARRATRSHTSCSMPGGISPSGEAGRPTASHRSGLLGAMVRRMAIRCSGDSTRSARRRVARHVVALRGLATSGADRSGGDPRARSVGRSRSGAGPARPQLPSCPPLGRRADASWRRPPSDPSGPRGRARASRGARTR